MWRAVGLKGKRFNAVQLQGDGYPKWAKIENIYDPPDTRYYPFIDNSSEKGPAILVR